jgi:hypothetical protein
MAFFEPQTLAEKRRIVLAEAAANAPCHRTLFDPNDDSDCACA